MEPKDIAAKLQLACMLEVTCFKPGNVSRYHDFEDTKYEHFLTGCMAMGVPLVEAVKRGVMIGSSEMQPSKAGLGTLIKETVSDSKRWHGGGNTNLGTAMLLVPLSAAAGISIAKLGGIANDAMRDGVDLLIAESTFEDSINLYLAIREARAGGLGRAGRLDVMDDSSLAEIKDENLNLKSIFELSKHDSIARESITRMEVSFEIGYPALVKSQREGGSACGSVLRAFFEILSRVPDSLIARKNGVEVAEKISAEARSILGGGLEQVRVTAFDERLRSRGNKLNPGATADLVASSLAVALLNDMRII